MQKRSIKIISMLVIVLALVMMIGNIAFAVKETDYLDPSVVTAKDPDASVVSMTQSITSTVVTVIQIVGITFAVAMLIFVAIKYLTSAAEGKAEIKKYAVAYIIGAILLFGASGILEIFKQFAQNNIKAE